MPSDIETDSKKKFPTEKKSLLMKNSQFLSNLNEAWSKLWIFITNELFSIGNFFMNQSLPKKDQHNRVRTKKIYRLY